MIELDATFFNKEIRSNYLISEKMKKVWAVELDLLQKFAEVCERNNLNYFLDGGTLLGAVRHKGFIPWDDDADVIMPREDYDRLFQIAEKEFEYPYFFQTTLTEDDFFRTHAQLRNSKTTGFIIEDGKKNINRGIFIDIFVLDGIPDNKIRRYLFKKELEYHKKVLYIQNDIEYAKLIRREKLLYLFYQQVYRLYPYKKYFQYFNKKVLAKFSNKNTKLVGDITLDWRTNVQWPREWFGEYIYLSFENLQLRAPRYYHEVLTRQYGDYMKIPENVNDKNGKSHGAIIFEPDIPYKEYFKC